MTTIISDEEKKEEMMADEAIEQETAEENTTDENEDEKESENSDASQEEEPAAEQSEEDEALNIKYMRLMADFQNFRKRSERERSEIYARANESIVTELLEVADNYVALLLQAGDCTIKTFPSAFSIIPQFLQRLGQNWRICCKKLIQIFIIK